jgi:hypothetical protein
MKKVRISANGLVLALAVAATAPVAAQQSSSPAVQARTNVIAASFNKSKHVRKEKHGITTEKYLRVESVPAVKANPAEYSGRYEVDGLDFGLDLRVNNDGSLEGTGHEPLSDNVHRTFTLKNGRIQGALLTATKVYAGGSTERLEGAFMNRSRFETPTDRGLTTFGLGVLGKPVTVDGNTFDRFFYERVR